MFKRTTKRRKEKLGRRTKGGLKKPFLFPLFFGLAKKSGRGRRLKRI
jgi:hypothetical protein